MRTMRTKTTSRPDLTVGNPPNLLVSWWFFFPLEFREFLSRVCGVGPVPVPATNFERERKVRSIEQEQVKSKRVKRGCCSAVGGRSLLPLCCCSCCRLCVALRDT